MDTISRRDFVKQTAAAAGTLAFTTMSRGENQSPNNTIRVAVAGVRGRGISHIEGFEALPGVEVVALCDVDENILGATAEKYESKTNRKLKRYRDFREVCDDKEIDAISIATPNHWHSLMGIWAMQAGKDAYVEKPCSHNIYEGRKLVEAARKYNRMCQHGTQGRSCPAIREAIQKLHEGVIGEVYMARGLCYKWRPSIGKVDGPQPIPKGIDYNLWLGPAQEKPLMRKNLHYDWHWQWDYGNGDMGNQGVHEMDMARWGLGVGLPKKISGIGDHFMFDDDQETPNTLNCSFHYPEEKKLLVFETRHWITNHEGDFGSGASNNVGVIFYGSEGYMTVKYFEYKTYLGRKREPGPAGKSDRNEWATFIAGVRSRNNDDLGVDIEEGHYSSALCHLGNISYRLGRTLEFDPKTERFVNDEQANAMLTRDYRSPFVVPETV